MKCPKCGTATDGKYCHRCGTSLPSDTFQESSSVPNSSIDECTARGRITTELWQWAENFNKIGKVLFIITIIGGLIKAIVNASVTSGIGASEFNFWLFLSGIIEYGIYAVLVYAGYHAISLLIGAVASITQYTKTTAKIAEYEARKREAKEREETSIG